MSYQIGQHRYPGKTDCLIPIALTAENIDYVTAKSSNESISFQDLAISYSEGFEADKSYYIRLAIPQDTTAVCDYNVKLKDDTNYQLISSFTVLQDLSLAQSTYQYPLALLENPSTGVIELRQISYWAVDVTGQGSYVSNNYLGGIGSVYYKDGIYYTSSIPQDANIVDAGKIRTTVLTADWMTPNVTQFNYMYFDFVFTPLRNFNTIVVEMVRNERDLYVRRGEEYGRKINSSAIAQNMPVLYEVNNWVIEDKSPYQRIGVWGRPGLSLVINGEEIKVGPSGYYELDALPISFLGVVPTNSNDQFTIDYTYEG